MTPIYLTSMGIAGMMVMAAVHNKRSGWRKPRTSTVRDLYEMSAFYRGLSESGATSPNTEIPVIQAPTPEGEAVFTSQLSNLRSALHQDGRVVAETKEVAVKVRVHQ